MKQLIALASMLLLSAVPAAWSQETPEQIIQRQEAEERAKALTAKVVDLEVTCQTLQKQIDKLEAEMGKLREELAASRNNNATAALEERMKRLVDEISTVDKKRLADNERLTQYIEKSFAKLEQSLKTAPPRMAPAPATSGGGSTKSPAHSVTPGPPVGTGKVFEYSVVSGDTLSGIIAKIRKEAGFNLTQKQVMDVNPTVNWNRLKVGQKIFIPEPKK